MLKYFIFIALLVSGPNGWTDTFDDDSEINFPSATDYPAQESEEVTVPSDEVIANPSEEEVHEEQTLDESTDELVSIDTDEIENLPKVTSVQPEAPKQKKWWQFWK